MKALRLGVVSYLNSRPLVAGLEGRSDLSLRYDVPAALPALLDAGQVDVALIPIIDVVRSPGAYRVVSDAGIACDGETMTVRVFSQLPPDRITRLCVDGHSHTSVALATVLWRELYGRALELRRIDAAVEPLAELPAVLLIGDKVVNPRRGSFAYEVDLGGAWRQLTGLPFVFAVWAARTDLPVPMDDEGLFALLGVARDRGVARVEDLAREEGPRHGWPVELAQRYLARCLRFTLTPRFVDGANLFAKCCGQVGLAPDGAEIRWPESLADTVRA